LLIEKARKFQNIHLWFTDYPKVFDCGSHKKMENSSRDGNTRSLYLLPGNQYAGHEATVRTNNGTTD